MKKFIFSTTLVIFVIAAGWYYTPSQIRERLSAFIGLAARRDTGEIKNFIEDVVLPEDAAERREVLIGELKKNITEIKRRSDPKAQGSGENKTKAATTGELIEASERALEELEKSSGDASVGGAVADKILEIVLPNSPTKGGKQCRQVCE